MIDIITLLSFQITIDNTVIEENSPPGKCVSYLGTETLETAGEVYDRHTYSITDDATNRLEIQDFRVCLLVTADYEELPNRHVLLFIT